jgi:hypothetical protein
MAESGAPPRRKHRATGNPRGGRTYLPPAERHVYQPDLAKIILERMAQGESVAQICRSHPDMPCARVVRGWKFEIEGFAAAYAKAKQLQAEAWEDEVSDLYDSDHDPQEKRVRFDIKRWLMSKTAPTLYGDKLTVAGDPSAPLQHVVRIQDAIDELSDAELAALERFTDARLSAIDLNPIEIKSEENNKKSARGIKKKYVP